MFGTKVHDRRIIPVGAIRKPGIHFEHSVFNWTTQTFEILCSPYFKGDDSCQANGLKTCTIGR